jgi:TP901-1 family phage major tail protein
MTESIAAKDFLLKVDQLGDGNFRTLAGLQTRRLSFDGRLVDITNADSEGNWREAVAGVDVRSMKFSGEGILARGLTYKVLNDIYFGQIGAGFNWQIIVGVVGYYKGRFIMPSMEFRGEQSGVIMFSADFESSGPIAFTGTAA